MVDKLYIMLPEFKVKKKYRLKDAWKDFYKENPKEVSKIEAAQEKAFNAYLDELEKKEGREYNEDTDDLDAMFNEYLNRAEAAGWKQNNWIESTKEEFSKWFKRNKNKYYEETEIFKIKYNYDKKPQEQSKEARNNALIDLMWGVLTNEDTVGKMLNPGGFDKQKTAARIVSILDYTDSAQLKAELEPYMKSSDQSIYTVLISLPIDVLDEIANKFKIQLDPLNPSTQVILHQQNMTGGKMIGIYANHNANHALMQHTELGLSVDHGSFLFNGKRLTSLHNMKNDNGEFISRNNANFLGASVDNVKDNTLHATNQNPFTGDISMLLSRLGYNPTEIAVLMRQPIIMEITQTYFRESRNGESAESIIENIIKRKAKDAGMYDNLSYKAVEKNPFKLEDLMKNIQLAKDIDTMSAAEKINFNRSQVAVGLLFQRIKKTADALGDLVQATRADTGNGAAGPTIADTIVKMQKLTDFMDNYMASEKHPLVGADILNPTLIEDNDDIDTIREKLLDRKLSFLQAFYSLGLARTNKLLSDYFPHYSKAFMEIINGRKSVDNKYVFFGLRHMTKSGKLDAKTINSIYNDLLAYIMTKIEFFGNGVNDAGNRVSSVDKRRSFINNFPAYFKKVVAKNPDIGNLEFIKRLKYKVSDKNNPVAVLNFTNVGTLSPTLRDRYTRDWATLLHMKNPEANKLALNLFLYNFYRNGFAFGPNTFNHLAPLELRKAIDGYIETLRDLLVSDDDYKEFIYQYLYNHLDNRKFCPELSNESHISILGSNNSAVDEVHVYIAPNTPKADMKIVKSKYTIDNRTTYTFFEFFTKKNGNKNIYYRLAEYDDVSATYVRINPLGYKNAFIEYEYSI